MTTLNLIFLGPPGSGKGTQSKFITETYGIPQISTGDLLRAAAKADTPRGREIKTIMQQGKLIPDQIINRMLEETLREKGGKGFLLDGYPRNYEQAVSLDGLLETLGKQINVVLNLAVSESLLLERLTMRRVCSSCAATYHLKYQQPQKPGTCDSCQSSLYQRDDDKEDTIRKRFEIFNQANEKIVGFYRSKKVTLVDISGDGPIENVTAAIKKALDQRLGRA